MCELQAELIGALIGLARAIEGNEDLAAPSTYEAIWEGLACCGRDSDRLTALISQVREEKRRLVPNCFNCAMPCGRTSDYDMKELGAADEDVGRLKSLILFSIKGMAASIYPDCADKELTDLFCKALYAIGADLGAERLTETVREVSEQCVVCCRGR